MTSSLVTWIVAAVLLFWAVGAYNRLVRLRADVNAAFAALYAELLQHARLVDGLASQEDASQPAWLSHLQAASTQLAACLQAARSRPLDGPGIAALAAAAEVLALAWDRAEREDAHDLGGPRLPPPLAEGRQRLLRQADAAALVFDDAVARYNQAIAEFPALLMAWVFGFKPGRGL